MRPNEQSHRLSVRKGLTVLLSTLCLAACQDDSLMDGQAGNGRLLFNVSTPEAQWADASQTSPAATKHVFEAGQLDGKPLYLRSFGIPTTDVAHNKKKQSAPQTRGIPTNDINDFHNNFGLFGYLGGLNSTGNPDFLYNLQVKRSGTSNNYSPADNQTYYLPGLGQKVGFYAYAPYNANGLILPATTSTDEPIYTYTVPTDFAAQQDLCFATAEASTSNGTVSLDFKHALAAVRIVVAGDVTPGTVSEVRLMNIKNKATLNGDGSVRELIVDESDAAVKQNFTLSLDKIDVGNGSKVNLTPAGEAFLMLPQELLHNATLEIDFEKKDNSEKKTFSAVIGGSSGGAARQWEAGFTYTYTLSFQMESAPEFNVTVTGNTEHLSYQGTDLSFNVTSRQDGTALPYVIEYRHVVASGEPAPGPTEWTRLWSSNDGLTASAAFSNITTSGNQTEQHTQKIHLSEASYYIKGEARRVLANTLGWGTDTHPSNIVNEDNGGSTANCYVVHRAGFHEIPMVYGNALSGGNFNNSVLSKGYVDYLGKEITANNYYAGQTGERPVRAELLWQDVNGLVSEVHMATKETNDRQGKYYIHFRVYKGTITEGNAVIAAFDSQNRIMWSWHIWVTCGGEQLNMPTASLIGTDNKSRRVLKKPLGWVEGGTKTWAPRNLQLRFRLLNESTNERVFNVTQNGHTLATSGSYTLYQWGRKDPMGPVTISGGTTVDAELFSYDPQRQYLVSTSNPMSQGWEGVNTWIQNPHRYNTNDDFDDNGRVQSAYLWNAAESLSTRTSSRADVTKSIYDPCPYGFKVPPKQTFGQLLDEDLLRDGRYYATVTGELRDGNPILTGNEIGVHFDSELGYLFFPLSGIRIAGSGYNFRADYYGTYGFFWTTGKYAETKANNLSFDLEQARIPGTGQINRYNMQTDIWGEHRSNTQSGHITNCLAIFPIASSD